MINDDDSGDGNDYTEMGTVFSLTYFRRETVEKGVEIALCRKDGRIYCLRCDKIIGQSDESGKFIYWSHTAPCGLWCAAIGNVRDRIHLSNSVCYKCEKTPCPPCHGSGWIFNKGVPDRCQRCKGVGRVAGYTLSEDEWSAYEEFRLAFKNV